MQWKNIFIKRPANFNPENEFILDRLILLEEFMNERFIAALRIILTFIFTLGYFFQETQRHPPILDITVLVVLSLQIINSIITNVERYFSRIIILITITIDVFCITGLFYMISRGLSFKDAVDSEVMTYLQIIFLAFQVIRMSRLFLIYYAALLLTGRLFLYFGFRFFSEQSVSFEGSAVSAIIRYICFAGFILIFLYTTSRTKQLVRKAIDDYLEKNNLLVENKQLENEASVDSLTGLFNVRYLNEQLPTAIATQHSLKQPLSLLLIDIDNFKKVNDSLGHSAGDEVLKKIAAIILSNCSSNDIVARYGGDEICVILPEKNLRLALETAEKMRSATESEFNNQPVHVTLSIGVATTTKSQKLNSADLFSAADRAMYKAKNRGRNKVYS